MALTPSTIGLKMMPELAFSCLCGKEIYRSRNIILGNEDYPWEREYQLKNGPPVLRASTAAVIPFYLTKQEGSQAEIRTSSS